MSDKQLKEPAAPVKLPAWKSRCAKRDYCKPTAYSSQKREIEIILNLRFQTCQRAYAQLTRDFRD